MWKQKLLCSNFNRVKTLAKTTLAAFIIAGGSDVENTVENVEKSVDTSNLL